MTSYRWSRYIQRGLALSGALVGLVSASHAFGGEDPLMGRPWHHEDISEKAAAQAGFSTEAADSIAWHADYVDSYLYNPLWWAPGGITRFKAALSTGDELEKVHFDDLFSSDQVRYMWRRYTSGTVAGLLWAKERGDVAAAQNIVGVSLHAIQDFYSHSNWVDNINRRGQTFLGTPVNERATLNLYTGAYEQPDHTGIKSHGKYAPAASILLQPGVSQLMDLASSGYSPLQNLPIMDTYRKVKNGTPVQPYIPGTNTRLPEDILYLAPSGIALDSTWMAEIGVKERGLTDLTAIQAFNLAKSLAIVQSEQWLKRLEEAMNKAGNGAPEFWKKVKNNGYNMDDRTAQYEKFNKFPYTFLSAGPYPPTSMSGEEYYLRVRLKTSGAAFAGTNSDIKLNVGNQSFLLDYMPRSVPVLAHDDFEAGDDEVYVVGPFASMPSSISLKNDSPSAWDIVKAAGRTILAIPAKIGDLALSLIGGHADHIATGKKIYMPEDLAGVNSAGQAWQVDLNGGDEGYYRVLGNVYRLRDFQNNGEDWVEYKVTLGRLDCIKESKWDRGSNSDEPFVMALVSTYPGSTIKYISNPFDDVDKGESRTINVSYTVQIPKKYGVLNIPVSVMEHDDESADARRKLLDAFAGQVEQDEAGSKRNFVTALDAARAADWKLERIEVYAWARNGTIKCGTVLDSTVDRWVDGGATTSFALNTAAVKPYDVTTDWLVSQVTAPGNSQPEQPSQPTEPTTPAPPPPGVPAGTPGMPSAAQLARFKNLRGDWKTNISAKLTIKDAETTDPTLTMLYGRAIKNPGQSIPNYGENMYLQLAQDNETVEGQFTLVTTSGPQDTNNYGRVYITLSEDGNHFTGRIALASGKTIEYTGERIVATNPIPGNNTQPGNPTQPQPAPGNPTQPIPSGPLTVGASLHFRDASATVTEVRSGAVPGTVEVFVRYHNDARRDLGITAGTYAFYIFDEEGVGFRSNGNVYSASGDRPETISRTLQLAPNGEINVRYVFNLPKGSAPLRRLFATEGYDLTEIIDISGLNVRGAGPQEVPSNIRPSVDTRFMGTSVLDVRLDGFRKSPDGRHYEAFLSIKNPTQRMQGFTAGSLRISLRTKDGEVIRSNGNLYRVGLERPEYLSHTVQIQPGTSAKVRVMFDYDGPEGDLRALTVQEGNSQAQSVNLP